MRDSKAGGYSEHVLLGGEVEGTVRRWDEAEGTRGAKQEDKRFVF